MAVTASRLSLFTSDIRRYLPLISLTAISHLLTLQQCLLHVGSFCRPRSAGDLFLTGVKLCSNTVRKKWIL